MQRLPVLDLSVIVVYFVCTMGVGLYFMRKSRQTEGFMVAGRALPSWLVGMSILSTNVSSITFLAVPGNSYLYNWSRLTFSLSIPLAVWISARFFVPLYRQRAEISAYSYLEHRFGPIARSYAAIFYLLTQIARMGSIMYLVALPFDAILHWKIRTVILIIGISTTVYAMLGGIEGVIWTDTIQGFILIGGALLCVLVMIFDTPGGFGRIFAVAVSHHKFSLGSFDPTQWSQATFWVILLNGIFINLQNFGVDQNYVQRYITAESEKTAKRALWLGGLLYLPVSFIFFVIGTELFSFYTTQPGLLPKALRSGGMADRIFPYFIVTRLPTGVTGLVIAAVFAAAMSSIASSLNSSATIIFTDFYKRYFRKDAGEKESMKVLYSTTLAWGVLGTMVAIAMINVKSALDAWWALSSVFSGGMLGLFLLGYFAPRATRISAALGMGVGLTVILWMTVSQTSYWIASQVLHPFSSPFHSYLVIVFGTATIFLVGFFASVLTSRGKATNP